MCIGVFVTGMLYTYTLRGAPPLQPFAMLGGAMWAIGNASCPFIIRTIGMGLGLSIWGTPTCSRAGPRRTLASCG